jgi:hypothetical protein
LEGTQQEQEAMMGEAKRRKQWAGPGDELPRFWIDGEAFNVGFKLVGIEDNSKEEMRKAALRITGEEKPDKDSWEFEQFEARVTKGVADRCVGCTNKYDQFAKAMVGVLIPKRTELRNRYATMPVCEQCAEVGNMMDLGTKLIVYMAPPREKWIARGDKDFVLVKDE